MAQSVQATPTLQANIAGSSTTVNLRDWLNTRLSPFLKKAIIESFDVEAEYPLQWLGEHLIQQSILFEGNPDTTNVHERFRYKHEAKPPTSVAHDVAPSRSSSTQPPAPPAQVDQPVNQTAATPEVPADQTQAPEATSTAPAASTVAGEQKSTPTPAVNVNGTTDTPADQVQDTEMSNAP